MHSFSQFTRSTLWGGWGGGGEFWGAIILGGNFPRRQLSGVELSRVQSDRGKLSGAQFSSGEIVLEPERASGYLLLFLLF